MADSSQHEGRNACSSIAMDVTMDLFRQHYAVIADIDAVVEARRHRAPTDDAGVEATMAFYRGTVPILLVAPAMPASSAAGTTGTEGEAASCSAAVPLHVMDFHRIMLPPSVAFGATGEVEPLDRVADADQVAAFGRNFIEPSIALLREATLSECTHDAALSRCTAPVMGTVFPSVLERFPVADWAALTHDGAMLDRLHYSYTVLLHYYGWRLHNEETGEVDRHKNWRLRYEALSGSIETRDEYAVWTRMLRVLLELRMSNYVARWLQFLLQEFKCNRLTFLRQVWDDVWMPLAAANVSISDDMKRLLAKHRRRLDADSSDDENDADILMG